MIFFLELFLKFFFGFIGDDSLGTLSFGQPKLGLRGRILVEGTFGWLGRV